MLCRGVSNVWNSGENLKISEIVRSPFGSRARVHPTAPWGVSLLLIFALLLLVELALPGPARLASINPHPFWIPVILLSMQYGTTGGLAAALTGIGLTTLIGFPGREGGEEFYEYANRIWRDPILWLGTSVVLGGFRSQELYKFETLREKLAIADGQRQSIAQLCNQLKVQCESLERSRACANDRSIETGLAALADVRNARPENLRRSIETALDVLLGPGCHGALICRDHRLLDVITPDGGAAEKSQATIWSLLPAETAEALLREKRMLSILREEDIALLAGQALFAAPILTTAGDRVVGALLIDRLAPELLQPQTEIGIQALSGEISLALAKAPVMVNFEHDRGARQSSGSRGMDDVRVGKRANPPAHLHRSSAA